MNSRHTADGSVADRSRTRPGVAWTPRGGRPDPRRRRRARRDRRTAQRGIRSTRPSRSRRRRSAPSRARRPRAPATPAAAGTSAGSPTATGCATTTSTSGDGRPRRRPAPGLGEQRRRHGGAACGLASPAPCWARSPSRRPAAGRRGRRGPRARDDRHRRAHRLPRPAQHLRPATSSTSTGSPVTPTSSHTMHPDADGGLGRRRRRVEQAADTAAFFALHAASRSPATRCGSPSSTPTCKVSHHRNDDPIVFPGLPGASHNHTFLGNTTHRREHHRRLARGRRRPAATRPRTSRRTGSPRSTERQGGRPRGEVIVYYGSRLKDPSKTQPFPRASG